ncbi:hypothetical protein BDD12DRAFT_847609 [Trichophaea hybrida]|nr:hypothetical protein BDD12DRAFT_847609 [Trichophaea hybrida]
MDVRCPPVCRCGTLCIASSEANSFCTFHDECSPPFSPKLSHVGQLSASVDEQRNSLFYDDKQEKIQRRTDAKLFFQQQQQSSGRNSPLMTPPSKTSNLKSFSCSHYHLPQNSAFVQSSIAAVGVGSKIHTTWIKATGPRDVDKHCGICEVQGANASQFDSHGVCNPVSPSSLWYNVPSYSDIRAAPQRGYTNHPSISSELSVIYTNIQKVLDLRHKYLRVSLQGHADNPKDNPSWQIYPPPPPPVWVEDPPRSSGSQRVLNTNGSSAAEQSFWAGSGSEEPHMEHRRKPGENIGEDFIFDEVPIPCADEKVFKLDNKGVYQVYENQQGLDTDTPIVTIPTIREYYMDLDNVLDISSDGPSKSFAFKRLQYLEGRWNLYVLLNEHQEMADSKSVPHRDFYNVRKVDTHIHHSACMNQKHLLRFIKSKMKKCPDEVVLCRDGKHLTLAEVFASINLTAYDLSIDTLDMHAHTDSFHRFDKFNLKYNPVGESRLRTIFLKTDNYIKGRYLAEITKEVFSDLEASKYQMAEYRISIYGRSEDEWDKLAAWVIDNKLFTHNVRWLIQIPRLYDVFKSTSLINSFAQIIQNIFKPLFEVTMDPRTHPKLHIFLQRVIGFDSVDDESKPERRTFKKFPTPVDWNFKTNPPYSYWVYYLFANTASLNIWRKQRGFNTFVVRPHCGEAGDTDHLAAAMLCCHSISHGILLRKVPLLQYIFYLDQIGIAMSPLSNNALFLAYDKNPFLSYFKRGLNVSLSTDDPLQFAFTKEPLIEEYSVAAQIYKLSAVDMCELARNSVHQSGFEGVLKSRWLGSEYHLQAVSSNNMHKTNVPNIRIAFRNETLLDELSMIERYASMHKCAVPDASPFTSDSPFPSPTDEFLPFPAVSVPQSPVVTTTMLEYSHPPPKVFLSNRVHLRDGRNDLGTVSPGGHISQQETSDQEGKPKDIHISGSEPRMWPDVISSSMMRQSGMAEADKIRSNEE